jgi:polysaccharide deacetylase family protein (PEP-CTERM system associated)
MTMLLVNTFDVEPWWTTVPPCVDTSRWNDMPDRSEAPLQQYMDLCDEAGVKCTFFFIGWYAKRFPQRVAEVVRRGHEAGCHSLFHEDVATLSTAEFRATTREAKALIEDAIGAAVAAYRAPSFSFPPDRCTELLGELSDLGFRIDSSITTAGRIHGGGYDKAHFRGPGSVKDTCGVDIFEVPVPGVAMFGREVQVFGGGYLRLAPRPLLTLLAGQESYQVLYLHPHDFDTDLPPLPNGGALGNLRRRINIGDLRRKVLDLFAVSEVRSCGELLAIAEATVHV